MDISSGTNSVSLCLANKLISALLAANLTIFWMIFLLQGDANIIEGPSGVLYLGKLPAKVAPEYYAVLPARPPTDSKVSRLHHL